MGPMGRTGVAKKAEKYEVFGHPKAAKVDTGVMFELGVYFGARGVAKNATPRRPRWLRGGMFELGVYFGARGVAKRRDLGKVREFKIGF